MARGRPALITTAALGCLLPALASAETLTLLNFIPPADAITTSAFSCDGKAGEQVDASVRYGRQRKSEGGYAGGFQEVTFKGQAIDAALLGQLNAKVGERNIEHVAPGCQADGAIRLLIGLWDTTQAEGRERSIVSIQRGADGVVVLAD